MHLKLDLYLTLAKISVTCFGGGYAIVPLLQRELVEKKGWLRAEEVTDIFSIAQCTPGVIAVNAATYVGTRLGGVSGAACATLGVLTPPFIIITLVAAFFWPYLENPWVQHALAGLQVCACALILLAVVRLFQTGVKGIATFVLFAASLLLSLLTTISPVLLILVSGLLGLLLFRGGGKGKP